MNVKSLAIACLLAAVATPVAAQNYDLAGSFGDSAFGYGTIDTAGTFAAFAPADCTAIGIASTCYRGGDTYQVVGRHSTSQLILHPGPGVAQTTAVVFTAPTAARYRIDVTFTRGDTGGDGVGVSSYLSGALSPLGTIDATTPMLTTTLTLALAANETIGFAVDRGPADYFYDSTFLSGSITAVPEPATWTLMILGVGVMGFGLRRRIRRSEARFTEQLRRIEAGETL